MTPSMFLKFRMSRIHHPFGRKLRRLKGCQSGLALTEFAISLPFLLILATSGLELTNYALTVKQIGELSVMVADNASRLGAQSMINNKTVTEADINDVFIGADLQAKNLNLAENSRIILSSLQQNEDGGQWIAWQRCYGAVHHSSAYGEEDEGATGTAFPGMGPPGAEIKAAPGTAVMVVEVRYRYQRILPLIALPLSDISELSAFNVRDSRDLTGLAPAAGSEASRCDQDNTEI